MTIYVGDINDNDPVFDRNVYSADIPENVPISSSVVTVKATDLDSGSNGEVWYEITAGNEVGSYNMNMSTGVLTTNSLIDREVTQKYILTVKAEDRGFPSPRKVEFSFCPHQIGLRLDLCPENYKNLITSLIKIPNKQFC